MGTHLSSQQLGPQEPEAGLGLGFAHQTPGQTHMSRGNLDGPSGCPACGRPEVFGAPRSDLRAAGLAHGVESRTWPSPLPLSCLLDAPVSPAPCEPSLFPSRACQLMAPASHVPSESLPSAVPPPGEL